MICTFAPREALRYAVYSMLLALSTPLLALLIEHCINTVADGNRTDFLMCFLLLAIVSLASVWLGHFKRIASVALTEGLVKNCTPKIIDKLNAMRYSYFDNASTADIMERMSRDPAEALAQLYKTFINCVALAVRIFCVALLYFKLSLVFGITLSILMVVEIAIGIASNKEFNRLFSAELPKERKLSYIGELLSQKESVFDFKINQSIGYIKNIQKKLASSLLKERVGINLKAERCYLVNVLLMLVWTATLLVYLVKGRLSGTIELGLFCTLLGSYPILTECQSELSYYLSTMGKDWFLIKAMQEFFSFDEIEETENLPDALPEIVFSHVSFRYPGTEKFVLRDINFTLSSGQTIALVGANGSGKSTIVKLLCGLYEPTEGTITVNGKQIHKLSLPGRKKLFSAVFQDFQTYSMSVYENVGLGDVQNIFDIDSIRSALENARIADFVDTLPNGGDTNLDHLEAGGVSLSGGQSQRLAIARAYMNDACFFLLDEPTSAMDPVAESHLYQSFSDIIRGKGAVLVSHRLASAMIADSILVLNKGEIVQHGTHSELMSSEGLYKEMFVKQSSWYTEIGAQ